MVKENENVALPGLKAATVLTPTEDITEPIAPPMGQPASSTDDMGPVAGVMVVVILVLLGIVIVAVVSKNV